MRPKDRALGQSTYRDSTQMDRVDPITSYSGTERPVNSAHR